MTKTQKEQLKQQIFLDIENLEKEITLLEQKTQPIAPDCALGDLIREELLCAQDIDKKTLDQSLIRLQKLRFTLSKIDNEEYGVCLDCGDDILFQRLLLLPESLYCVECLNEKGF